MTEINLSYTELTALLANLQTLSLGPRSDNTWESEEECRNALNRIINKLVIYGFRVEPENFRNTKRKSWSDELLLAEMNEVFAVMGSSADESDSMCMKASMVSYNLYALRRRGYSVELSEHGFILKRNDE